MVGAVRFWAYVEEKADKLAQWMCCVVERKERVKEVTPMWPGSQQDHMACLRWWRDMTEQVTVLVKSIKSSLQVFYGTRKRLRPRERDFLKLL